MNKISVIVPVYNASKSLKRCLNSISGQDYENIEVLLVNDGSNDDSGSICDEYSSLDRRFSVIHIENKGVSNARNIGIRYSNGHYITFVDADDYVSPNYLSYLSYTNTDFSVCGCTILQEDRSAKEETFMISSDKLSSLSDRDKINVILNHHLVRPVWGKLFKRSLIIENGILFDSSVRLGEDTLFVLSYLKYIQSAHLVEYSSYFYYRDSFKINKFHNHPDDFIFIYTKLHKLAEEFKVNGYIIDKLLVSNYKSLANNYFLVLYLSSTFTFNERKRFFFRFQNINPLVSSMNFGISNSFLSYIYKFVLKINSFFFIDFFFKNYFGLLKWKNQK